MKEFQIVIDWNFRMKNSDTFQKYSRFPKLVFGLVYTEIFSQYLGNPRYNIDTMDHIRTNKHCLNHN